MKKAKNNSEFEQYRFLIEDNPELDDFLKKRAGISLQYFIENANKNKSVGNRMSMANVILPAAATVAAAFSVQYGDACGFLKLVAPLITSVTTIVAGMIAYFQYGEKKNSYRSSAERIKNELVLFYYKTGGYKDLAAEDAKELFVKSMEEIIGSNYKKIIELEKNSKSV